MKKKLKRYQQAGLVAIVNLNTSQIRCARTGEMLGLTADLELDKTAFGSRLSAEALLSQANDPALAIVLPLDLISIMKGD